MSKIVYTYGVFDLFHYGHLIALKNAKKLGDRLIIGVFTDRIAESFKRKPILGERDRFKLIQELEIGEVVYQDTFLPSIKADIIAKAEGAGWSKESIPQFPNTESVLLPYTGGISTSEIIKKIYAHNIQQYHRKAECEESCCKGKSRMDEESSGGAKDSQ